MMRSRCGVKRLIVPLGTPHRERQEFPRQKSEIRPLASRFVTCLIVLSKRLANNRPFQKFS